MGNWGFGNWGEAGRLGGLIPNSLIAQFPNPGRLRGWRSPGATGTCWIGSYNAEQVKAVLGVPADYEVVYPTPVGVPDQDPAFRGRKPRAELFMKDRFGEPLDYSIEE